MSRDLTDSGEKHHFLALFSDKMARKNFWQAIDQKAYGRIRGNGRGCAFSQRDFARLGSRDRVDKALQRLLRKRKKTEFRSQKEKYG